VAVVSAALAVYASGLLYEGFVASGYAGDATYPFVDKAAAERAWNGLGVDAPAAARRKAALRLVRADPASPRSWTALAYADRTARHALTPAGVAALEQSYQVSFFDLRDATWRVDFALENWPALTPPLRQQVLTEAQVALADPRLAPAMKARLRSIRDPAGHLAAALLLAGAR